MNSSTNNPKLVKVAQWLFFLNSAIWLVIGVVSLVRLATGATGRTVTMLVVAILMFGNVGAWLIAVVGIGIERWRKLFYFFGMVVLVVNIVLTVTDQFGLLDFVTLVIDLALFGLMIAARRVFFING
jgi:hypothetical protein